MLLLQIAIAVVSVGDIAGSSSSIAVGVAGRLVPVVLNVVVLLVEVAVRCGISMPGTRIIINKWLLAKFRENSFHTEVVLGSFDSEFLKC